MDGDPRRELSLLKKQKHGIERKGGVRKTPPFYLTALAGDPSAHLAPVGVDPDAVDTGLAEDLRVGGAATLGPEGEKTAVRAERLNAAVTINNRGVFPADLAYLCPIADTHL
jgi:hypothetical protein